MTSGVLRTRRLFREIYRAALVLWAESASMTAGERESGSLRPISLC